MGQVIQTKKISIVSILLANGNNIELHNIIFAFRYNLNLFSLGQLPKITIIYHDDYVTMTLIK